MSFSDVFTDTDEASIMDALGDVCTYNGTTIHAIIDYGLQDINMIDAYTTAAQIRVQALKSSLPNVKRGSKLVHNGKTLVVDAITNDTRTHLTLACRYV
jgi:hypothetical protein